MTEEDQAVRLMQKLTGEAATKMADVKVKDVQIPGGVEKFMDLVNKAYESIEDYRVGKVMDDFLDQFQRKSGQEIADYNRAWFVEVTKAE